MQPRTLNSGDQARAIFDQAPFIRDLGIRLDSIESGCVQSSLRIEPRHRQQDGFVHAGVQATIADHTAGGAGALALGADEYVLSIEFKINLLRPARGPDLVCRASILRAGRSVIVAESEVYDRAEDGVEKLTAKATVTLAAVKRR